MSGAVTDLDFKWVSHRRYLLLDSFLLWLWERYAAHLDQGQRTEANATRAIIADIMEADA